MVQCMFITRQKLGGAKNRMTKQTFTDGLITGLALGCALGAVITIAILIKMGLAEFPV